MSDEKRESLNPVQTPEQDAADERARADKRKRLHVRRRVVKHRSTAAAAPQSVAGVRPTLNVMTQRAIPRLQDIDPALVADYIEQYVAFVKAYSGWDIDFNREAVELRLADVIALVAPAVEFALQVKGKEVTLDVLEPFVLSLIRAVVLRVNLYAKTNFVMDDAILENLAVTFRNVYYALRKDWANIDQAQQTGALLTLFARCLPGCLAACQKPRA